MFILPHKIKRKSAGLKIYLEFLISATFNLQINMGRLFTLMHSSTTRHGTSPHCHKIVYRFLKFKNHHNAVFFSVTSRKHSHAFQRSFQIFTVDVPRAAFWEKCPRSIVFLEIPPRRWQCSGITILLLPHSSPLCSPVCFPASCWQKVGLFEGFDVCNKNIMAKYACLIFW